MKHVIPLLLISIICAVRGFAFGDPDGRFLIAGMVSLVGLNIVVAIHKAAK